jgi:hypothetical protein
VEVCIRGTIGHLGGISQVLGVMDLARVFSPPCLPNSTRTNQLTALDRTVIEEERPRGAIFKVELQGVRGLFAEVHDSFSPLGTDFNSAAPKIDFLNSEFGDFTRPATRCIEQL